MKLLEEMEVLKKINSLNPNSIDFLSNEKFKHSLKFTINTYTVYLNFNSQKKAECFIYNNNHYYFSLSDRLHIIFEYLYLIVTKSNSETSYNAI